MRFSPDQLEKILDAADIGIWQLHVASGLVTRSEVIPRILHAQPADLGADRSVWIDRIHPEDRTFVAQKRQLALAGELDTYSVDYRVRRADESWAFVRGVTAVGERDASGKPLWLCGLLMDISRQRELERRLHAVFDRPFQFIGLLTPQGRLIETNRISVGSSGYELEDVLGKLFWEGPMFAGSPAVQRQLQEGISRAAAGEHVRFEMCNADANGETRTIDFTLTPLRDDDGAVANIIPEGRDITDLAQARETLRDTERRLKTASEAGNIGLWDSDIRSGLPWFSDQWWFMLGYGPDELPKTMETYRALLHPEDRKRVLLALQAYTAPQNELSAPLDQEYRMRCKDGSWRWIHGKGRIVERDEEGNALRITGVHIDITDRKEAELRLAAAERLESIGRLAAGVAHEINTPVQYVNDSVYFVREGVQELLTYCKELRTAGAGTATPPADLEYLEENLPLALERAVDGLMRVAEIVRSMKEFSHADQTAMAPVDLNRAIQSTLVVARSEFKYVADLVTDFGELPHVVCHGGQINQVVLNLVVNAAHAIADRHKGTQEKGVITVGTRAEGDEVVISITDTGCGIPDAIRHRIFEPFFTTKDVGRGTGQGLSIARQVIVQGHGGSMAFETELGTGTTFRVRLPRESPGIAANVVAA